MWILISIDIEYAEYDGFSHATARSGLTPHRNNVLPAQGPEPRMAPFGLASRSLDGWPADWQGNCQIVAIPPPFFPSILFAG